MEYKTEPRAVTHSQFLALVYHDIFSYPLTGKQLVFWQIGEQQKSRHMAEKTGPFYHLPGSGASVLRHLARRLASQKKLKIAQKAARLLSFIPTVKLVGISGALAMNVAQEEDDIDLFIISAANSLWMTRLLARLTLALGRVKVRKVGSKDVANKLCLNLWLDEGNLAFRDRQEIYTAHEILQTKVLFDRDDAYRSFLVENRWVARFFPKAFEACLRQARKQKTKNREQRALGFVEYFLGRLLSFAEPLARLPQLWYMRRRRTRETVEQRRACFHPFSWRELVLEAFEARLQRLAQGKNYPLTTNLPSQ